MWCTGFSIMCVDGMFRFLFDKGKFIPEMFSEISPSVENVPIKRDITTWEPAGHTLGLILSDVGRCDDPKRRL